MTHEPEKHAHEPEKHDYRPRSGKCELHLIWSCNLACRHCNRQSFLRIPHTPPMTIDDVANFLHQAQTLNWYPALILIGGEPTLHPDLDRICELCRAFADRGTRLGLGYPEKGLQGLVQMWSNQTTVKSRQICELMRYKHNVSIVSQTIKIGESIPIQKFDTKTRVDGEPRYEFDIQDIMVSPYDLGYGYRPHCWQHGSEICGISVDSQGYTLCSTGGAVCGMLKLPLRTRRLADLFDPEWAAQHTMKLCQHCGNNLSKTGISGKVDLENWAARVKVMPKWHGMPISPTWEKAMEGRD